MADCECLQGCIFFNDKMKDMPVTAKLMKKKYCQGDKSLCARYYIFSRLGKGTVPDNLFPNDMDRAVEIVAEAKKADE